MRNPFKSLFGKSPSIRIQELQSGSTAASSLSDGLRSNLRIEEGDATNKGESKGQALLDKHGFPEEIADAFSLAAKETNCVIMSRAPGGAVLELVKHGHDLKSFQIKSKSCDWGPMSGFLCQLTCFNKKGSENIDYNDKNYVKYFKFIRDKQKSDADFKTAVHAGQTAFIPLQLFDARKEEILKKVRNQLDIKDNGTVVGIASHETVINKKKQETVIMEFLIQKAKNHSEREELWSVYHGRVFYRKMGDSGKLNEEWSDFFEEKISYSTVDNHGDHVVRNNAKGKGMRVRRLLDDRPEVWPEHARKNYKPIDAPEKARSFLDSALHKLGIPSKSRSEWKFYPICVAQNPFPPYRAEGDLYKNAVTGDYDLFAVWPARPQVGWQDLVRLCDLQVKFGDREKSTGSNKEKKARKESFFVSVPAKPFALELRASPEVYVEVIPGFKEIEQWEDPETGNINTAVATAAQTLNSFVFAHMLNKVGGSETEEKPESDKYKKAEKIRKEFSYPNVAFHSDEGGRPGIDEIDLPIAVFLPESVTKQAGENWLTAKDICQLEQNNNSGSSLMIIEQREYEKFLKLCVDLRHKCILMFNHEWLTRLFALVVDTAKVKKTKKTEKYFNAVTKEQKELGPNTLSKIRLLLSTLFIGGQLRIKFEPSGYWGVAASDKPKEVASAEASMNELANAFVMAVGKEKAKAKWDTLHEAMIHIPDRNVGPAENAD